MTSPLENLAGPGKALTVGLGPEVWRVLSKCHEVRNRGEYEGDLDIDERLVTDLVAACQAVADKVATLPSMVEGPSQ